MSTRIIIPTCDRPDALTECLVSVKAQTSQESTPYEVVVVDSGALTSAFMQNFEQVMFIQSPRDIGFSKAVNLGAKGANADWIVWLNDDCVVLPLWLNAMLSFMETRPKVGIGVFFFSDCRWPDAGYRVFFYRNEVYPNFGCTSRAAWEKLNGFDSRFFSYGAETDIGRRCRALGFEVTPVPGARVHHKYLKDAFRKAHVARINQQDYEKLRLETYGPESDDNLHWMNEMGEGQSHRTVSKERTK